MTMPLLNYTTTIAVMKTVGQIQSLLVQAGARSLMTDHDDAGHVISLSFAVPGPNGLQGYRLPVNTERVQAVLLRQRVSSRYQTEDQAERVAWRIVKDWVEAQVAILETEMVTLDQVMLPYATTEDGRTIYDLYVDRQLALTSGSKR